MEPLTLPSLRQQGDTLNEFTLGTTPVWTQEGHGATSLLPYVLLRRACQEKSRVPSQAGVPRPPGTQRGWAVGHEQEPTETVPYCVQGTASGTVPQQETSNRPMPLCSIYLGGGALQTDQRMR